MKLDTEHVTRLARAFGVNQDGTPYVALDLEFMTLVLGRLNMWERGLLQSRIARAAAAYKRSPDQRLLLALFAAQDAPERLQEAVPDDGGGADTTEPNAGANETGRDETREASHVA